MQNQTARAAFLRRLHWSAVIVPALFIFLCETVRHRYFDDSVPVWLGNLISAAVALCASSAFAFIIFHFIARLDADLIAQNRRFAAINALATVAHQQSDEQTLLAVSAPIIRDALGATVVTFNPDQSGAAPPDRSIIVLRHNGMVLGTLSVQGTGLSLDRSLLISLGDVLAVAIANRRLAAQSARVAVLEERDRIARELHDGLAQMLATITLQSERAHALLADGNSNAARVALDRIGEASGTAYADVREAIVGLRMDTDRDLLAALRQTAERFTDTTEIAVEVAGCLDDAPCLPPQAELQLLRIAQEGLTNVRKHAHATRVTIRLASDPGTHQLVLTVQDDGVGFDPDHVPRVGRQHFGLLVMRERVESLGGRLAIRSNVGNGTIITATLPLAAEAHGVA